VQWLPFDLHPEYPRDGIPRAELEARYGAGFGDNLARMFEEAGLPVAPRIDKVPNSRKALRLGELARARGLHDALHPRLFDAYWARGLDIGDDEVLVAEGTAVGLDEAEVRELLAGDAYLDVVEAATRSATEAGAGGVPAWAVDRRVLIPGAQPHEVFEQVLGRLGHAPAGEDG
jgi:predicted DsbA family dithiol-disulfide isomerase